MELGRLDPRAGLAQWSALFARKPAASRMTISTSWGWLAWEAVDSEAAHLARLAASTPAPALVEIAVGDPESQKLGRRNPRPTRHDRRLECADRRLLGGVAGVWLRGLQSVGTLVLAVATAAGATAIVDRGTRVRPASGRRSRRAAGTAADRVRARVGASSGRCRRLDDATKGQRLAALV